VQLVAPATLALFPAAVFLILDSRVRSHPLATATAPDLALVDGPLRSLAFHPPSIAAPWPPPQVDKVDRGEEDFFSILKLKEMGEKKMTLNFYPAVFLNFYAADVTKTS
jgi:hypothetical protein